MHPKTKPVLQAIKTIEKEAIKGDKLVMYKGRKYFACTNPLLMAKIQVRIGNQSIIDILEELKAYGVIEYEVVNLKRSHKPVDPIKLGLKQDVSKLRVLAVNWECEFLKNNM